MTNGAPIRATQQAYPPQAPNPPPPAGPQHGTAPPYGTPPAYGAAPAYGTPPAYGGGPPPYGQPPPYWVPPQQPRRPNRGVIAGVAALVTLGVIAVLVVVVMVVGGDDSTTTNPYTPVSTVPAYVQPDEPGPVLTEPWNEGPLLQGPVDVLDSFAFDESIGVSWEGGGLMMHVYGTFLTGGSARCTADMAMDGQTVTLDAVVIGDRAWMDSGTGSYESVGAGDSDLAMFLSMCPSSHELWGEQFATAPPDGVPAQRDGMDVTVYDVTADASEWQYLFGLPAGLTSTSMTVWTAGDGTWIAGVDATVIGSADTFRSYMGLPSADVTGNCTMQLELHVTRPNDPSLTVVAPM